jgi:CcmD family protein
VSTAEKYVTAAYCVVFAIVLVYVVIIALKMQRLEREVDAIADRAAARDPEPDAREVSVVG